MPDAGASSAPAAALTPRRVPEGYVRAEVASFPLTSEQAFRDGITFLDPALEERGVVDREIGGNDHERTTRKLWRACEDRLILQAGGWSLDRLVAVRDQTWFAAAERAARVPMHHYLRHLAHAHVARQSGASEVHREPEANELNAVIHYYWLSFSIP